TTSGLGGASVAAVSGSGSSYTVTVNTGTGDGTLRLDVSDDDSIQDAVGNSLGGTGTGNGDFTAGEVYTVHRLASVPVTLADRFVAQAYLDLLGHSADAAAIAFWSGQINGGISLAQAAPGITNPPHSPNHLAHPPYPPVLGRPPPP